jgi:hypothetical protein
MRLPMTGVVACVAVEMYLRAKRESEERRKAIPYVDRTGSFVADYLDKSDPNLPRPEWRRDVFKPAGAE